MKIEPLKVFAAGACEGFAAIRQEDSGWLWLEICWKKMPNIAAKLQSHTSKAQLQKYSHFEKRLSPPFKKEFFLEVYRQPTHDKQLLVPLLLGIQLCLKTLWLCIIWTFRGKTMCGERNSLWPSRIIPSKWSFNIVKLRSYTIHTYCFFTSFVLEGPLSHFRRKCHG